MSNPKKIFFIAGEASGDLQASLLVKELKNQIPDLECRGLGGPLMANEGVELMMDLTKESVLGFTDVVKKYFSLRSILYQALRDAESFKPDAIILVDYPGFNLRFAKKINKRFKIIYYISPQLWAWGKQRLQIVRKYIDHMIVLFHFEKEMYDKAGIPSTWIGHPLIEEAYPSKPRNDLKKEWFNKNDDSKIVTMFAGSRKTEVKRILPEMLKTAEILYEKTQNIKFLLSESTAIPSEIYDEILKSTKTKIPIKVIRGRSYDLLHASDFALITSGTATLETAICETPFVILYKTAFLTFFLGRILVEIPYIGLANVVAGRKIVPEFIQHEIKPELIAEEAMHLLYQGNLRKKMIQDLKMVKENLGSAGAVGRATSKIKELLE